MFIKNINLDSTVFYDIEREDGIYTLQAKVLAVKETSLITSIPYGRVGEVLTPEQHLHPDDVVNIRVRNNSSIYRWVKVRHEVTKMLALPAIEIFLMGEGVNVNRREVFRLPFIKHMEADVNGKPIDIYLNDISLIGVGFKSLEVLEQDDTVTFDLSFNNDKLHIMAKIIRITKPEYETDMIIYGAIILKAPKELNHFILEEQRKLLRVR